MDELIPCLKAHFDSLEDRLRSFAAHGVQVEGWFKGKLIFALDVCRKSGAIQRFDREIKIRPSRRAIDLYVQMDRDHWVELKHWLIGEQKSAKWGASDYFSDSTGLINDVNRLLGIEGQTSRWLFVLATANPGQAAWQLGIDRFNTKFALHFLSSVTDPAVFPSWYYLGLLKVNRPCDVQPVPTTSPQGLVEFI
jgi:hypothetical protein